MNLRSTLATSAAAVALLAGGTAQAAGDFYVSIFGGYSTFDDEIEFAQSTSNSLALPGQPIPGGPTTLVATTTLPGYTVKLATTIPRQVSVGKGSGALGPYGTSTIAYVKYATSRTFINYKVMGSRVDYISFNHQSYFQWDSDFDNGFVVGAALGSELVDGWRGELEVAYRSAGVGNGKNSGRINGNLVQDIRFPSPTLYLLRAYNAAYSAFGGVYTPLTIATGVTLLTSQGPPVSTYLTGKIFTATLLPVSNTTATKLVTFSKKALSSINGPTVTLPNAATFGGNVASSGDAQVWSIMANIWHDFDFMGLNPDGVVTFAGGGIGVASLDLEYNASAGTYFGGTIGYGLDDSGVGIAYQLGAGIGFDLGGGSMLTAQYRWFGTSDIDVGNTDLRVESHNALVSFSVPIGALIP